MFVHVIESVDWTRATGYKLIDHGFVEARDKMHAAEQWFRSYYDTGVMQHASASQFGQLNVSHPDGKLFHSISFVERFDEDSLAEMTDDELMRLKIHTLNRRDAYGDGRVPDDVRVTLARVVHEQNYRRVLRRLEGDGRTHLSV